MISPRIVRLPAATAAVLLAVAGLMSACSDGHAPREQMTTTVTGDGDVRVVENTGTDGVRSRVRLREVYTVGWEDDEPTFEFITTGKIREDGRVVLADANGTQVYVLAPDGRVEFLVGREGEGPGEYTWLDAAVFGGGDTIYTQSGAGRLTTFLRDSVLEARQVSFGLGGFIWDGRVAMELARHTEEGDFLFIPGGTSPQGTGDWVSAPALRLGADLARLDTLLLFDGSFDQEREDRNPLRRFGAAWPAGTGFVVGRNDRPELRWYDAQGALTQVARWDHVPREMTDAAMDDFTRRQLERGNREVTEERLNQMIAEQRRDLDGPLPIWRRLLADEAGNVWLGDFGEHPLDFGKRAFLVAADGSWLGAVETRDRVILMDATERWLLGVVMSALDVQAVVLWEILR